MFSLDNFYYILYANLLKPANLYSLYFYPFGSTSSDNICQDFSSIRPMWNDNIHHHCLYYDQEPLIKQHFEKLNFQQKFHMFFTYKYCKILANSEHSLIKKQICKENGYIDWYYFFHGFAALDWYRDFQYFPSVEYQITKIFISLNRLTTKDRSYRLLLASHLINEDLIEKGHVSLSLDDMGLGTWQNELVYKDTKLPTHTIPFVKEQIGKLPGSLTLDQTNPQGDLSSKFDQHSIRINKEALWHVVTETVFYYDKLHLTEKIFKPIVHQRPFILVAAPGNLAYLKSYGFKTFDRWIDESYDNEQDPAKRIEMVVAELKKLCQLSMTEINQMYQEMKEVLDYNFNHFYGKFKTIIANELVDNFEGSVQQWNNGRVDGRTIDISHIDLDKIKRLLGQ